MAYTDGATSVPAFIVAPDSDTTGVSSLTDAISAARSDLPLGSGAIISASGAAGTHTGSLASFADAIVSFLGMGHDADADATGALADGTGTHMPYGPVPYVIAAGLICAIAAVALLHTRARKRRRAAGWDVYGDDDSIEDGK
jgi:hypothetical protein